MTGLVKLEPAEALRVPGMSRPAHEMPTASAAQLGCPVRQPHSFIPHGGKTFLGYLSHTSGSPTNIVP